MRKARSTYLALVAVLMAPMAANADVVQNLHLQFASGAVFNGTVTFADGFDGMLDVDGTLSGGGYRDTDFTWTYLEAGGYTNPHNWDGDAGSDTWEDLLMNGRAGRWSSYIGLSWFRGFDPVLNLNTDIV
ncbi:MAG: hypothetical protein KJP08_06555, partial [Gammaproteobacteria bacterium]|nr:hypothetical protein [Gammaproteobacteria bacterium]